MNKLHWIQKRVFSSAAMLKECNAWRTTSQKIVFTNGCFDILHHGHLDLLARAASLGNRLVVGLNTDRSVKGLKGSERPITNEADRAFQLASLLYVDAVCLFDEDTPQELIALLRPDVLVKGGDYTIDKVVGADMVTANGGTVEIIPFVDGYSTTAILQRIKSL